MLDTMLLSEWWASGHLTRSWMPICGFICRTGGVVVIAFVLHTKGPKFDPWSVHFLFDIV